MNKRKSPVCRSCQKIYRDAHYKKDKKKWIGKILERKLKNKEWLKEIKSYLKCNRCPENHPSTLHFHHTDSSKKESSVSNMIGSGTGREKILREMSKCEVLCANCHSKHHWNDKNAGLA